MSVSSDPQNQTAVQIRKLRDEMRRNAQAASLKRLKRQLPPDEQLITQAEMVEGEGSDE
jgi:hypothetical protein